MVVYVVELLKDKLNVIEWMKVVCDIDFGGGVGGVLVESFTATWATASIFEDIDNGKYYLKFKDNVLMVVINYLCDKGLFLDDFDFDFGDNFVVDFEW